MLSCNCADCAGDVAVHHGCRVEWLASPKTEKDVRHFGSKCKAAKIYKHFATLDLCFLRHYNLLDDPASLEPRSQEKLCEYLQASLAKGEMYHLFETQYVLC